MRIIHIGLPDRTQSQYEEDQLRMLWQQGAIPPTALYWTEGMPDWRPLPELFPLPSPPIPPAVSYQPPQAAQPPPSQPAPYSPPIASSPQPTYQPSYGQQSPYQQATYQPPYSQPSAYGMVQQAGRFFTKDPASLTRALIVFLWIYAAFSGAIALMDVVRWTSLQDVHLSNAQDALSALIDALLAVGRLLIFIVTVVLFCKWVHRANTNVRGFGARGLEFTPEWAVGYYFIPVMCLVRPYQAMSEIWRASKAPADWQTTPLSGIVGGWWAFYLLSNIASYAEARVDKASTNTTDMQTGFAISILVEVMEIVSAAFAVILVKKIYEMQADYVANRS